MTDDRMIRAPWTPEQVTALNAFQKRGGMHPFTCGGDHTPGSPALVAYTDGWRCPQPYGEACDYRQDWAHRSMAAVPVPASAPTDRCPHGCDVSPCLACEDDQTTLLGLIDNLIERCPEHGCVEPEWEDGCHCEIVPLLRRLADDVPGSGPGGAADETQHLSTADKAAALGLTDTEYRARSHAAAVATVRAAIPGMYAHVGFRLEDVLNEADETRQPAPWLSDSARIGRTLIWSWADIGKGAYGKGYRDAQAQVRSLLGEPASGETRQPETQADPCSGCRYVPCGNCQPSAVSQPTAKGRGPE